MRPRLFLAFDPTPAQVEALRSLVASLRASAEAASWKASWSRSEKWHVTLKFLGAVPLERLPGLQRSLRESFSGCEPWDWKLEGVGAFPSARRARVLWAGVRGASEKDTERMRAAAGVCETLARELGLPEENRPYSPHLTLARFRVAPRGLESVLASRPSGERWGEARATDAVLYESRLKTGEYVEVARFPLGRGW